MKIFSIFLLFNFSTFIIETAEAKSDRIDTKAYSSEWFDVNSCQIPITNYGEFGYMFGFWPKGSGEPYIFGSGIWIGGIKAGSEVVSCGYNTYGAGNDFMPGPPEHNEDHALNPNAHPEDRVLLSTDEEDLAIWPLQDSLGEPVILGDLDMWCEYNDCWPDQHAWDPGTKPLNVHVRQLTFGWTTKLYVNMFFLLYEIENVGEDRIEGMYIGNGADMDIGDSNDDLTGCDVARSLGYTHSQSQEAGWTSKPPYYVGVKFLQGPKADDTVFVAAPPGPDNPDYPNTIMDTVLPGEHLVLTSFTKCTREKGGDPANDEERYEMLSGYNIETHEYDPWQGVIDEVPSDKRQVMGCGPFSLDPGEIDTFLVGIMFSNAGTGGLEYLQSEGDAALAAYRAGWVVPSAPSSPELTAIPGNQKVTLVWDNLPEYTPDQFKKVMGEAGDTVYKEFDFEGYRLWKSRTGLPDDWEELGEWDIENDITLLPGDMWVRNEDYPDGFNVSGKKSNNEGLTYSYVDEDVFNGITYFYAVTSFDFNTPGAIPNECDIYTSLESGIKEIKCTPRAETGDFEPPTVSSLTHSSGNTNSLKSLNAEIMGNIAITGHSYNLEWKGIKEGAGGLPIYTYNILDVTDNEYISPILFESPVNEKISALEQKTTPDTLPDTVLVSNADSAIILRTVVWDTVKIDSTWMWSGYFQKPFDGLVVSGTTQVIQSWRNILNCDTVKYTLLTKPDLYDIWRDTTIISTQTITHTLLDTSLDCFTLPDSIVIENDIDTEYDGNLQVSEFYSSGSSGNNWAYRGGASLEIRWNWYNGSHDTITISCFDVASGVEIPYDSAFGDNWCLGFGTGHTNKDYLTGTQPPPYRIWFYVSGVRYYFNGGAPMNWATHPDSGDVWRIYSSAPSIPPISGNVYSFGTEKFEYVGESNMALIKVVPNPYVIRADWDRSKHTRKIQFTHLPNKCTIRLYNLAGDLIRKLEHTSTDESGGVEEWDIRTEDDQIPASGIYIYYISTPNGQKKTGKFALIR